MTVALDLPPRLAARPVDERRGLPIPWVNQAPDGSHDFVVINAARQVQAARERLCGLCGQPHDYWLAVIGGERTIANRVSSDPPMHVDCARAALRLCPHLAIARHQRSKAERDDTSVPPGFVEDKVPVVHLGITRSYRIQVIGQGDRNHLLYVLAPFKTVERHEYADAR